MASMTNYLEQALLDHVHGVAAYTAPTNLYVALYTSAPGDTGGGAEVSGGSYARQSVTFNAAGSDSIAESSVEVLFPKATASWGMITHAAILDASTGGNMLFHGALNSPREILTNDQFKFATGDITNTLD